MKRIHNEQRGSLVPYQNRGTQGGVLYKYLNAQNNELSLQYIEDVQRIISLNYMYNKLYPPITAECMVCHYKINHGHILTACIDHILIAVIDNNEL